MVDSETKVDSEMVGGRSSAEEDIQLVAAEMKELVKDLGCMTEAG